MVVGEPSRAVLRTLRQGVDLDDGRNRAGPGRHDRAVAGPPHDPRGPQPPGPTDARCRRPPGGEVDSAPASVRWLTVSSDRARGGPSPPLSSAPSRRRWPPPNRRPDRRRNRPPNRPPGRPRAIGSIARMPPAVRALRGATTVDADDPAQITERTVALLEQMFERKRRRSRRPDQHPLHGHARSAVHVPGHGRPHHRARRRAAAVRPGDPGRGRHGPVHPGPCAPHHRAQPRRAAQRVPRERREPPRRPARIAGPAMTIAEGAQRANVIGTGLIGASIGLALRDRGWHVSGSDANPATADRALERGAIDAIGVDADATILVRRPAGRCGGRRGPPRSPHHHGCGDRRRFR